MQQNDCPFCQIIAAELPSHKLYEDDKVIVILDRQPVREAHAMVIPKIHIENFTDLPDEIAAHIAIIGNQVGKKIKRVFKPKRIGFVVSGFGVPHVHYHIIPMHTEHDITSCVYASIEDGEITYSMKYVPLPDNSSQKKIMDALSDP